MLDEQREGMNESREGGSVSRREVLMGAVAATVSMAATQVFAGMDHEHGHGKHGKAPNQDLIDAAMECMKKSQACVEHCISLFKEGDTSLAECLDKVNETEAMCAALAKMAASDSTYLPEVAAVCRKVCLACEKECRKHEKHAACKACADACKECADECKKVAA